MCKIIDPTGQSGQTEIFFLFCAVVNEFSAMKTAFSLNTLRHKRMKYFRSNLMGKCHRFCKFRF